MQRTEPSKRIFIIGPMDSKRERKDIEKVFIADHVPNIEEATKKVLVSLKEKLGADFPDYDVIAPDNLRSGDHIPIQVFSHMLHCDLAIVDLTEQSPNVFYELAILHACGVPVILLGEPPFYLKQTLCEKPESFEQFNLEKALIGESFASGGKAKPGPLEQWTNPSLSARIQYNPITTVLQGVHLIDMAAATGVAAGFFHNFLKKLIHDDTRLDDLEEKAKGILLIKPDHIDDVSKTKKEITEIYGIEDGDGKKKLRQTRVKDNTPKDGFDITIVNGYVIDFPTPILSLKHSKQYKQMGEYAKNHFGKVEDQARYGFERRLIDAYFSALDNIVENDAHCKREKYKIVTKEQALELLRAE